MTTTRTLNLPFDILLLILEYLPLPAAAVCCSRQSYHRNREGQPKESNALFCCSLANREFSRAATQVLYRCVKVDFGTTRKWRRNEGVSVAPTAWTGELAYGHHIRGNGEGDLDIKEGSSVMVPRVENESDYGLPPKPHAFLSILSYTDTETERRDIDSERPTASIASESYACPSFVYPYAYIHHLHVSGPLSLLPPGPETNRFPVALGDVVELLTMTNKTRRTTREREREKASGRLKSLVFTPKECHPETAVRTLQVLASYAEEEERRSVAGVLGVDGAVVAEEGVADIESTATLAPENERPTLEDFEAFNAEPCLEELHLNQFAFDDEEKVRLLVQIGGRGWYERGRERGASGGLGTRAGAGGTGTSEGTGRAGFGFRLRKLTIESPTRILLQNLVGDVSAPAPAPTPSVPVSGMEDDMEEQEDNALKPSTNDSGVDAGWLCRLQYDLKELHLVNNCGSITPGVLRSFLPYLYNVTHLTIGLSYSLADKDVFTALVQLPNLKRIGLRWYLQLNSPAGEVFREEWPLEGLEWMEVSYSERSIVSMWRSGREKRRYRGHRHRYRYGLFWERRQAEAEVDEVECPLCEWVEKVTAVSPELKEVVFVDEDAEEEDDDDDNDEDVRNRMPESGGIVVVNDSDGNGDDQEEQVRMDSEEDEDEDEDGRLERVIWMMRQVGAMGVGFEFGFGESSLGNIVEGDQEEEEEGPRVETDYPLNLGKA
ncbi:hypothetical protein D9757_008180 [Collybiopsis confluens]|uniref:F-box domain-containing protein n=1 Tax=Collybiopsis confluens TaxID=2823264 RepID=A0A8H5M511_9AGAR|nr:hypothetical protein D9757_008180 [Collybiopsis confluens]